MSKQTAASASLRDAKFSRPASCSLREAGLSEQGTRRCLMHLLVAFTQRTVRACIATRCWS